VKYTTARGVAERAGNVAARRLDARMRPAHSGTAILPGAGIADHEALAIETARAVGLEIAPPMIAHLTGTYGDRCVPIIRLMAERSDWRMPLVGGQPTVGAEVVYAIRDEMACTLADVAIRRTERGADGYPGDALLHPMAGVAAEELGWDPGRRQREIADVKARYSW
jgi:glycerol-3-phosphate dehydrogenase